MQRDTKNQGRPLVLPHGRVAERPAGVFNPISLSGRIFFADVDERGREKKKKRRTNFLHVDDWTNFVMRNFCQYFISLSILYLFIYVIWDVSRALPYPLDIYSCLCLLIWRKLCLCFRRVLVQLAPVSLWLLYSYKLFSILFNVNLWHEFEIKEDIHFFGLSRLFIVNLFSYLRLNLLELWHMKHWDLKVSYVKVSSWSPLVWLSSQLLHFQVRAAPAGAEGRSSMKLTGQYHLQKAEMKCPGPHTWPSPSPGCAIGNSVQSSGGTKTQSPTLQGSDGTWQASIHPMFLNQSTCAL